MAWYLFFNDGKKYYKGGPFKTESDALRVGIECGSEYEIKEYATRDLARAGSMFRMELVKQGKVADISKRQYRMKGQ